MHATANRAAANDRLLSSDISTVLITAQKWSKKYSARNVRRVEIVMSNERRGAAKLMMMDLDAIILHRRRQNALNASDGQIQSTRKMFVRGCVKFLPALA